MLEYHIGHYIPFGLDVDIHYDIVFSKGDYIFCSESYQLIEINIKTLCQYTGLKDKNGNKVFEGDIIQFCSSTKPLEVYWIGISWALKDKEDNRMNFAYECDFIDYCKKCKVIGNKFDNPELLGDKV